MPDELEREKSVIVQEIGAAQDTPDDVVFDHLQRAAFPDQPMGRSILGTAKTAEARSIATMLRAYLSTQLSRPGHGGGRRRRGRSRARWCDEVEQHFASFDGPAGAGAAAGACSARAARASCSAISNRRI